MKRDELRPAKHVQQVSNNLKKVKSIATGAFLANTKATHRQPNVTIVLQTRIPTKPSEANAKFVML